MSRRTGSISWRTVGRSAQAFAAHGLLFSFTLFLVLKLDHGFSGSWWIVFFPVWLFHAVVARGRFSLPAPSIPHGRHWAPCHAVVATPLLIAFELLLCIHLKTPYAMNLKIVFLPVMILETTILVDNFRMCRALMPGDEESLSDDAIWETLPHFWIAISMVFFLAATLFSVLKLCGDIAALGWWDLFINFSIGECFAFLVCTKWSNPIIHRHPRIRESSSTSTTLGDLDWTSGLVVQSEENQNQGHMCGLQDIGGHFMKVLVIVFQILICMYLEGTPSRARKMPIAVIFSPLFLLQGVGVLFSFSRLVEGIVLMLHMGATTAIFCTYSSRIRDTLEFMLRGSRLLGWWSIDEGSREDQVWLLHEGASGYNTFCIYPPDVVKKMPKKDLTEEVRRLQAALAEQFEITKFSQQEHERLQNEKVLCRVCFEREITIVLLPCRHRILCSSCCEKCKKCPICRVSIEEQLPVYDV